MPYFVTFPTSVNPTALRKAKIVNNFGLSERNRVKVSTLLCLL